MAMLDMHEQIVLSEVAENEQPHQQEEVQLTELLPVKQSRIRENGIFKNADTDTDATDTLKILRSFISVDGYCNDDDDEEHELPSRNHLPFCARIGDSGGQARKQEDEGKQWRGDRVRKRVDERLENVADVFEIEMGKEERKNGNRKVVDSETRMEKRKRKRVDKKSSIGRPAKLPKRRMISGSMIGKRRIEENDEENRGGGSRDRRPVEDNKGNSSEYDRQIEATTYLDLDKSNQLNDEIYVYRREPMDDNEQRENGNSENYSRISTDGVFFDRMAISASTGKNITYDTRTDKSRSSFENSTKQPKLSFETTTIADYLDEGENNNRLKVREDVSGNVMVVVVESSSSSSSSSTTSSSSSSSSSPLSSSRRENGEDGRGGEEEVRHENQEKKYCCVVCEARFKGSGGLRNHYKIVHGAGPIFKCDECGKEFPLKERLKLHVRTHTGFKPYKCPECEKSFARGGQLVQHRRTHSQVKPYRCGLCSGTFTCAANLALHVKRHNGQKDHKCEICGRAFVRRDALKKHLECLHRDVKSFLCVICNKTFKGHLPQHMRTHARDRPHGCATCGQRFAQKSQLTVHQRTHSGQRPFRCLVCWQAFAHSTALKLHTRRHTGERPFKCAECNAGFTQLPHWKKHMKCIHGRNEPYACKKCPSFFRIKNDLECHEKTCHPETGTERNARTNIDSMPMLAIPMTSTLNALQTTTTTTITTNITTTNSFSNENVIIDKPSPPPSKYRVMTVERMRLLLAVLLKRISKQERLDELGFGKRLIDEVLHDSLISAGKDPVASHGLSELETLTRNLEIFLKWTVPKEHWENFRRLNKTPEDILETLTAT
ncbi:Zinc finger protein 846 [Anthophora plagiata]